MHKTPFFVITGQEGFFNLKSVQARKTGISRGYCGPKSRDRLKVKITHQRGSSTTWLLNAATHVVDTISISYKIRIGCEYYL